MAGSSGSNAASSNLPLRDDTKATVRQLRLVSSVFRVFIRTETTEETE